MEKRFSNIFKTRNVTKLTKTILKSSFRVLQVTSKWPIFKQTAYFLRAFEFWPTFDIQISITLAIFWKKLQNYTFQKAQRSLSKLASIHINRATHYEKIALKKILKICVFWRLLLQNKNYWHFEFLMNQILTQRFIMLEKWRYRSQLLLKLRSVKVATSFHWILPRST